MRTPTRRTRSLELARARTRALLARARADALRALARAPAAAQRVVAGARTCARRPLAYPPLCARRRLCGFLLGTYLGLFGAAGAHAQGGAGGAATFEVPPAPAQAPPRLAFDVHTGFSAPLRNTSLCPPNAGCVMQSGGGVGGSAERRWASGIGIMVAYDLWFLDTDSVYELGVQQLLRAGLRYTMPTDIVFHPVFEVTGGFMGYGDTFAIATVGVLAQVMAGAEVELTAAFGLRVGLGVRAFSHTKFRTERDGVQRGTGVPFSESFFFEVALTFL
jgi:hypothetical protein